jgi:hypothetical protein
MRKPKRKNKQEKQLVFSASTTTSREIDTFIVFSY